MLFLMWLNSPGTIKLVFLKLIGQGAEYQIFKKKIEIFHCFPNVFKNPLLSSLVPKKIIYPKHTTS
jgi:hypothetical protein